MKNPAKKLKIVGLGASMTAGTPGFFSPRERPPAGEGNPESQYAYWMMKKHPEWEVLNRGMRGQRTDQILMRFGYDVLDNHPHWVILLAGTNDLYQGRSIVTALENLKEMIRRANEAGIRTAVCTLPPLGLGSAEVKRAILNYNESIRREAARRGAILCDVYPLMENPRRQGFLESSPDDVHPDPAGYRKLGEFLALRIEEAEKINPTF